MKKITFLLVAMLAFCWQGHAQFTESFDTEIPATWTIVDVDGGDTWIHSTAQSYAGGGSARIQWDSNAHDDYLISPQFTVTAGVSDRISFWAASYLGYIESFEVLLSTTGVAPGDFSVSLGDELASTDAPVFEQFSYDLSAYDGTPIYIAIKATGADQFYLYVDEFVNDALPTCLEATNLDVTVLPGDTTANLSWDVEGSATAGYNWVVMNEFDDPDVDAPVASGSTAVGVTTDTATGLTAGNDYDFYVQSNCDTNGLSTWAGPINFTALAPPANNTCASAEVAPVGLGSCGTSVTGHNVGATDSGVAQAGCATSTYSGGDVWYTFDMPAGETEIEYTRSASVFSTTQVELYSGTCGALVEEGCTTSATASFTGLTSGATYYLRIYDWGNNDIGSFTFCLNTPPTCPVPTSLNATNITVDSADLEWTDNAGASAWDIEWGTNGFTPTETPNIEDTTNPHPLGGLSASTSYDYYVRADCGGGDTSPWAGPFTFTTADLPPACGENFYDTGGAALSYSANENYTITICPDVSGDAVTVEFNSFVVEGRGLDNCWDMLYIYDGSDNTGTPITPASLGIGVDTNTTGFCWESASDGTANLTGQAITATNPAGCLTFTFTSDGSGQFAGWDATVSCATIGTQEYNLNEMFSYYPNPVNNTLSLRGVKDIQNVAVYNMLGQEVLRTAPNTVNSDVDMSGLQSGTYFVKVMIENTTKTIKVIKK